MTSTDIDYVIREFGPAKWIKLDNAVNGVFLIRITPLPPPDELERVISDICTGGIPVRVHRGKVYHSANCQARRHVIKNDPVKRSLQSLKEETFKVAIHPNIPIGPLKEGPILGGQPIAIAFEPVITLMNYPDHPHLNMGNPSRRLPGSNYLMPDTLCYTNKPDELGNTQTERLLSAFYQITIWFLRYQIWLKTRELTGRGIWIGPQEGQLEADWFPLRLNPQGPCRCGSRKTYTSCHLAKDLITVKLKHGEDELAAQRQRIDSGWWYGAVYRPQITLFNALKQL